MRSIAALVALSVAATACEKKSKDRSPLSETERSEETASHVQDASDDVRDTPEKNYLSEEWAWSAHQRTTDRVAEAEKLREKGYALYKQKDDQAAVAAYEAALDEHPTGEIYYHYGNSLSNIDRLPDSVKAYRIALKLGYARPEVALYNTACAYSRMENADGAYEFLHKAVAQGYSAWRKIENDPDLKFLRARGDWKGRYAEIKSSSMGFDPEKLVGELAMMTERDDVRYTFCPDGTVFTTSPVGLDDDSCCGSESSGRWTREGSAVVVRWTEVCGKNGVGETGSANAICTDYKKCTERRCRAPEKDWEKSSHIAELDEMPEIFSGRDLASLEPGESTLTPFSSGVPEKCRTSR